MQIRHLAYILTLCAVPDLAPSTLHAASILWGAPTTISRDSDVSTRGTLLGAVNWGYDPGWRGECPSEYNDQWRNLHGGELC